MEAIRMIASLEHWGKCCSNVQNCYYVIAGERQKKTQTFRYCKYKNKKKE